MLRRDVANVERNVLLRGRNLSFLKKLLLKAN